MRACMRACPCTRACMHACVRACVRACMSMLTCVHAGVHACPCIRACMHACVCVFLAPEPPEAYLLFNNYGNVLGQGKPLQFSKKLKMPKLLLKTMDKSTSIIAIVG